ncbi:hypothetical protein E4U42_007716 [Claviceps africana]|uniref:Uncharacterized protein n=1 Tax=Claviceps africana TaxID=83212 RepID=A0A8K0NG07_9HYPO|nr:hypothetical protein E4U42_007716 [Claviceps africana]
MYYHAAIVMLFWPVSYYAIVGTELSPKRICVEAADAILALLKSYARLYTLGRTPSFTPYLALTASVVHLAATTDFRYERPAGTPTGDRPGPLLDALRADVAALEDMTQSHHLARKALGILGMLFREWRVGIDTRTDDVSLQDCIDICWPYSRTCQPVPPRGFSADRLDRDAQDAEWPGEWIRTTVKTPEGLRHPLFVPLLELPRRTRWTERALERAGFRHVAS